LMAVGKPLARMSAAVKNLVFPAASATATAPTFHEPFSANWGNVVEAEPDTLAAGVTLVMATCLAWPEGLLNSIRKEATPEGVGLPASVAEKVAATGTAALVVLIDVGKLKAVRSGRVVSGAEVNCSVVPKPLPFRAAVSRNWVLPTASISPTEATVQFPVSLNCGKVIGTMRSVMVKLAAKLSDAVCFTLPEGL